MPVFFYESNWNSEYREVRFKPAFDFFSLCCFPFPFQLYLSYNMLCCAFQLTAMWHWILVNFFKLLWKQSQLLQHPPRTTWQLESSARSSSYSGFLWAPLQVFCFFSLLNIITSRLRDDCVNICSHNLLGLPVFLSLETCPERRTAQLESPLSCSRQVSAPAQNAICLGRKGASFFTRFIWQSLLLI